MSGLSHAFLSLCHSNLNWSRDTADHFTFQPRQCQAKTN